MRRHASRAPQPPVLLLVPAQALLVEGQRPAEPALLQEGAAHPLHELQRLGVLRALVPCQPLELLHQVLAPVPRQRALHGGVLAARAQQARHVAALVRGLLADAGKALTARGLAPAADTRVLLQAPHGDHLPAQLALHPRLLHLALHAQAQGRPPRPEPAAGGAVWAVDPLQLVAAHHAQTTSALALGVGVAHPGGGQHVHAHGAAVHVVTLLDGGAAALAGLLGGLLRRGALHPFLSVLLALGFFLFCQEKKKPREGWREVW